MAHFKKELKPFRTMRCRCDTSHFKKEIHSKTKRKRFKFQSTALCYKTFKLKHERVFENSILFGNVF